MIAEGNVHCDDEGYTYKVLKIGNNSAKVEVNGFRVRKLVVRMALNELGSLKVLFGVVR